MGWTKEWAPEGTDLSGPQGLWGEVELLSSLVEGYFFMHFVTLESGLLFISILCHRGFVMGTEVSLIGLGFASIKETNPLPGRSGQGWGEGEW